MASHELLQGLIGVTLAGSAAIVPVLALRRPLRKVFGAQVAYALWWLVPAAMAAALLPALAAAFFGALRVALVFAGVLRAAMGLAPFEKPRGSLPARGRRANTGGLQSTQRPEAW